MRLLLFCITSLSIAVAKPGVDESNDRESDTPDLHTIPEEPNYDTNSWQYFQAASGADSTSPKGNDAAASTYLVDGSTAYFQLNSGTDAASLQSLGTLEASSDSKSSKTGSSIYDWDNPGVPVQLRPVNPVDNRADISGSGNVGIRYGSADISLSTQYSKLIR